MKNFSKLLTVHNLIFLLGIIGLLVWYYYSFFWGERVWANHGAGWDGANYYRITKNFENLFLGHNLNAYRLSHVLPCALIYYVARFFGLHLTSVSQVISAYLIYQYILLIVSVIFITKISNILGFKLKTKYFLYAGIFITLPILKKFLYIPIGTDITALFLGVLSFYFFLKKQIIPLFVVSLLGAFTYPSMIYSNLLLLLFSQISITKKTINNTVKITETVLKIVFVIVFAISINWLINIGFKSGNGSQQANLNLILVSSFFVLFYLYRLLMPINFFDSLKSILHKKHIINIVVGIVFYVAYKTIVSSFSNDGINDLTNQGFLKAIIYGSVTNPLASLVCHISYYGPFIFFIIVFWKKIYAEVEKYGIPLVLFVGLYLILSLGRESRQFINAWPIFVIITCVFIDKYKFSWRFTYFFLIISIIYSKIWFVINIPGIGTKNGLLAFPAQRFFMMNGAWMSTNMYYVHAIGELITFVIFYYLLRKEEIYKSMGDKNIFNPAYVKAFLKINKKND